MRKPIEEGVRAMAELEFHLVTMDGNDGKESDCGSVGHFEFGHLAGLEWRWPDQSAQHVCIHRVRLRVVPVWYGMAFREERVVATREACESLQQSHRPEDAFALHRLLGQDPIGWQ